MRWIWIDRFEELVRGERAAAIKCVSRGEAHLTDHFEGDPQLPASLMIEGMAQTAGILLGQTTDFKHLVVLAKVPRATFHRIAYPGDVVRYEAVIQTLTEQGGSCDVTATLANGPEAGAAVAEAEILFAHLDPDDPDYKGADQRNFVFTSNLLQVMD
ncbi:beta-hydroxyacyl-ACP dehydratase [Alienimonas sp. DA493]|uniref:beta-hydroxyacyl-ACP dehydratase n=1 Tax=Alienimonas sp. DA493 TaxID=3373605 RepID=UPI00375443D4